MSAENKQTVKPYTWFWEKVPETKYKRKIQLDHKGHVCFESNILSPIEEGEIILDWEFEEGDEQ